MDLDYLTASHKDKKEESIQLTLFKCTNSEVLKSYLHSLPAKCIHALNPNTAKLLISDAPGRSTLSIFQTSCA